MLAKLPDEVTEKSERVGRNLAIALQAFIELQPFLRDVGADFEVNLSYAPVLFHLQNDPTLMEYIQSCQDDVDNLDLKKVCFEAAVEKQ